MVTGTAEQMNQDSGQLGGKPPEAGKGLEQSKGGAEPEKTYRQSEVDAMLGKAGQKIQAKLEAITAERDQYKSQVEETTTLKNQIEVLNKEIEAMSDTDPDKQAIVKLRRMYEAELKTAQEERNAIKEDKAAVQQWKRDQLVYQVADEYVRPNGEAVDFDVFKEKADKFSFSTREQLEELAETMGLRLKSEAPPISTPNNDKPYSGMTSGGQSWSYESDSARELIKRGLK